MNINYFDKWSEEMSYYLGWLWADGSTSGNRIHVGCITEDEHILLSFMEAIKSDHKVIRLPGFVHKKGYCVKPYTKCNIYNKHLVNILIQKHGILPRKTYLNLEFPKIPQEYLPHFIRGYFDGDGSMFKRSNGVTISLIGTKNFIFGMGNEINKQIGIKINTITKNNNTKAKNASWLISWYKHSDVLTFLNFIYCGNIFLKRKKEFFDMYKKDITEYCNNCGVENSSNRIRLRFLGKNLGTYKTIEECQFARNYAHLKVNNYYYPIQSPKLNKEQEERIIKIVDNRLIGVKMHQRTLLNYLEQNDVNSLESKK